MNANEKNEINALIATLCERDLTGQGKHNEESEEVTNFIAKGFGCNKSTGMWAIIRAYTLGFMAGFDVYSVLNGDSAGGSPSEREERQRRRNRRGVQ